MNSTNVDLGFLETDYEAWEVASRHFPSKVGGKPAWLDLKYLPAVTEMECQDCHQPRKFLLQVRSHHSGGFRHFRLKVGISMTKIIL